MPEAAIRSLKNFKKPVLKSKNFAHRLGTRVHTCRPRTSCKHPWRLIFECTSKKPWCSASPTRAGADTVNWLWPCKHKSPASTVGAGGSLLHGPCVDRPRSVAANAAVPSPESSAPNVWDSKRSDNSCFGVILSTLLVFAFVLVETLCGFFTVTCITLSTFSRFT